MNIKIISIIVGLIVVGGGMYLLFNRDASAPAGEEYSAQALDPVRGCTMTDQCVLLLCSGPFNAEYAKTLPTEPPCAVYAGYQVQCLQNLCTAVKPANGQVAPPSTNLEQTAPATVFVTHAVAIQNFAFAQSALTVKKGDTVVWTNKDSAPHTVTGDGGLDSGTLSGGQTYSFTFATAGTFSYKCNFHPSMAGKVIVQ